MPWLTHACNPSTLGGQGWQLTRSGDQDYPGQHGEIRVSTKNTKISQVSWYIPVIPATWETEAGESLEPGRQRRQRTKITPLNSSLEDRMRLSLKKQKGKKEKNV